MDLNRIDLITEADQSDLEKKDFVENLIVKLGFNKEIQNEQPKIVKDNFGGLLIWQYPNQFSNYLVFIKEFQIKSYMEIGCRWGGTFVLTTEYLNRFGCIEKSVAVDIIDSPVKEYTKRNSSASFLKMNSQSDEFKKYIDQNEFDLIFIDGDHSYQGVKNDYELCKDRARIYVFHDIVSDACEGVKRFWNELKKDNEFEFYEFTQQYEEVMKATGKKFLGIGVAIRKTAKEPPTIVFECKETN